MSDYYNKKNGRKRRSKREKIGFYTAFSICLVAVCMAVYSTYNTLSVPSNPKTEQLVTEVQQVNQPVTGVTEIQTESELIMTVPTVISETSTEPDTTTEPSEQDALQTMLSTDLSLEYPLKATNVLHEYSTDSTYFKTLNVWRPHLGVDFTGELGDDVFAMSDGTVTKVAEDKMYGKTIEISKNDAVCIYSGLGSINVEKGDTINKGDKIGVVGNVPFESSDENHIHVEVKVGGNYADPISFIDNDE